MFKEKSYKSQKSEYERVKKEQVKCPDHKEHKRNCIHCEA